MLSLLRQDGYSTSELEYYIIHGDWPRKRSGPVRDLNDIEGMVDDMVEDLDTRRTKRMKRSVIVLSFGIIFIVVYFVLLSFLGNDVSKPVSEPTQIEETQNGSNKL